MPKSRPGTINTKETVESYLRRMTRAGYVVTGVYFSQTTEEIALFGHLTEAGMVQVFRGIVAAWDAKNAGGMAQPVPVAADSDSVGPTGDGKTDSV